MNFRILQEQKIILVLSIGSVFAKLLEMLSKLFTAIIAGQQLHLLLKI